MALINLTGVGTIRYDIRASRTGSNIKIGIHDTGGTTTEHTANISTANTFETQTWDISGVADANKDAIDQIIITILNANAANTFYIDNISTEIGLTVQTLTHSNTLGTLALIQIHNLIVNALLHLHNLDAPILSQIHKLAVQTLSHAHSIDELTLTQIHQLVVQTLNHLHAIDEIIVGYDLIVQYLNHTHSISTVTLSQIHDLIVDNLLHRHILDKLWEEIPLGSQFSFNPMVSGYIRLHSEGLYQFLGGIASSIEKYLKEHSGETYHQDKL